MKETQQHTTDNVNPTFLKELQEVLKDIENNAENISYRTLKYLKSVSKKKYCSNEW